MNSALSLTRYTGTSTGYTYWNAPYNTTQCGRVRAAYTSRLAGWGYWSGFSGSSCQTPSLPVPATPPASSFNFSNQRLCAPASGFQVAASWSGTAYATSYTSRMEYMNASFMQPWQSATSASTSNGWVVLDSTAIFGQAYVQVRANNASGSSSWSSAVRASIFPGCQSY